MKLRTLNIVTNHGSSITSFWDNEIENAKYEPRAYWARARRDAQNPCMGGLITRLGKHPQ